MALGCWHVIAYVRVQKSLKFYIIRSYYKAITSFTVKLITKTGQNLIRNKLIPKLASIVNRTI